MGFEAIEKHIEAVDSKDWNGTARSSNPLLENGEFHANGHAATLEEGDAYEGDDQAPKYEKTSGNPEPPISPLKIGSVDENEYVVIPITVEHESQVSLASKSLSVFQSLV